MSGPERLIARTSPFGSEYAWSQRWNDAERWYVRTMGIVDLPGRIRARLVLGELDRLHWRTLLDCGCGAGSYPFYVSRCSSVKACGIDINETRIADCIGIARQLDRTNVEFHSGSCEEMLPALPSAQFDVGIMVEVLELLPEPGVALSELHRVIRPGGHLICHVVLLDRHRDHSRTAERTRALV